MEFYGNKAKALRVGLGLKTESVAKKLNVSRRTLWAWENSRNIPSKAMVKQLAEILQVSVSIISDLSDADTLSEDDLIKSSKLNYDIDKFNSFDLKLKTLQNSLSDIYSDACSSSHITSALLTADKTVFYIKNKNLQYAAAGSYYKKILGYSENFDFKGKVDKDIMSHRDSVINEAQEREVLLSANSITETEMIIPGTKGKKWGIFSKSPIRDKYDKVSGIVVIAVDITGLRKEEQRIALTIGMSKRNDSVIWKAKFNAKGRLICRYLNKDMAWKFFGSYAEELLDADRIGGDIARLSSEKHYSHVFCFTMNNNKEWVKETIYQDGTVYYGILKSYTEKKKLDMFRKTLEANFSRMKDGVVIQHDITKELIYANRAIELIYEREIKNYLGINIDEIWLNEFVHPDDREFSKELYDKDKYPTRRTFRIITPNGKVKWIEASVSYRIFADGIPTVITVDRDITARVDAEEKDMYIKSFFDNIKGFMIIWSKKNISYVSENVENILGYNLHEINQNMDFLLSLFCNPDGSPDIDFTINDLISGDKNYCFIKTIDNNILKFECILLEAKAGDKSGIYFKPV